MSNAVNKLAEFWGRRSLKFWLAIGMALTSLPIFISAVAGYFYHHHALIHPLTTVSTTHRYALQPLQSIRLSLWTVSDSVIEFEADGQSENAATFRKESAKIDAAIAKLEHAVKNGGMKKKDVEEVRASWRDVAPLGQTILASPRLQGDANTARELVAFEASMTRLNQQLARMHDDVRVESEHMHDQALLDLAFLEWLTIAGLIVSIILAALGVGLINRTLVTSMNQLAYGAKRLAAGDTEHQVEVHLPHELVNVANAFNMMTEQILEQKKALERSAATDGLTGLHNRRELDRMMADEVRRAGRYEVPVSLVMSDIDHFKRFNDTHGHQAGDEALRAVAQAMKDSVREVDMAGRFGGEEFTLILPACNMVEARQMAERVRAAVEALTIDLGNGLTDKVTISLGIATYPADGTSPEALLKKADEALYVSKEQGRNRVTPAS